MMVTPIWQLLYTLLYQFAVRHITWSSALVRPCCAQNSTTVRQLVSATIVDKLERYRKILLFDAGNDSLQFISTFCQHAHSIALKLSAHLRMAFANKLADLLAQFL